MKAVIVILAVVFAPAVLLLAFYAVIFAIYLVMYVVRCAAYIVSLPFQLLESLISRKSMGSVMHTDRRS